jgi:acyl carrier protein
MRLAVDDEALQGDVRHLLLQWVGELLGDPQVRLEDNFLDLGGHSMLAVELSRRAQERLGAPCDMRVLFESSLSQVADQLSAEMAMPAQGRAVGDGSRARVDVQEPSRGHA